DAVLGKNADIVTLEQGARVVQVCEAMIESSKNNTFVEIN
ncbi:gfo/Idh/MocA family oxidoreductase, partial [Luteococcus sp. H154]